MAPPPTVNKPAEVPPPGDVPWWGALILAVLTSIVSVIGTILFLRGGTAVPGAPPGVGMIFTDIVTFLPHILIVFGIFADIFTLQGAYSIPSLVGLLSIPIHFMMQFLWTGASGFLGDLYKLVNTAPADKPLPTPLFSGTNTGVNVGSTPKSVSTGTNTNRTAKVSTGTNTGTTFDEDVRTLLGGTRGGAMSAWKGCEVYGFEKLTSPYAPQGLVVTATIFWYYLLDLWVNRDGLDSIATAVAFPLFFGLQVWLLKSCDNFGESVVIKSIIALVEGLIIGGIGYAIVQATIPDRLPSSVLPKVPRLSSMTKNPDGTYTDSNGKKYVIGIDGTPIPEDLFSLSCPDFDVSKITGLTSCPKD
jgi:hypothetical protein